MIHTLRSLIAHPLSTLVNNPVTNVISKNISVPSELTDLTIFDAKSEVAPDEVTMTQQGVDTNILLG